MRRGCWVRGCVAVAMLMPALCRARAQGPATVVPKASLPKPRNVSVAEYRAHLDALRQLVAECGRVVTACDATKVGDDDLVQPPQAAAYVQRYGWLRTILEDRNDEGHKLRAELLPRAEQRLVEQEAELDNVTAQSQAVTQTVRDARSGVLSRAEFRTERGYSWRERAGAWLDRQLAKLFGGASTLGRSAPWLGTALQWGAVLGALALLALWVYRALDRQRIALGRLTSDAMREEAMAESRAWAEQARKHADAGAWRDAVHALYWASIVLLEDRRTLRRNGTRTPREALRLIDTASPLSAPLRAQTGEFERIWYGLQMASERDYASALQHYGKIGGARQQGVSA